MGISLFAICHTSVITGGYVYFKNLLLNGAKKRFMCSVIPALVGGYSSKGWGWDNLQLGSSKNNSFSGILCVYVAVRIKFVGLF